MTDWYVLVKIRQPEGERLLSTGLERMALDVAYSLPAPCFESAHVVFEDAYGRIVRPNWSKRRDIVG